MRRRNGLMEESVMVVLLSCGEVQDLTSSRQGVAVTTQAVTTATTNYRVSGFVPWVNSGRRDVRYGPKSQANQNSTSSHLAECNITRFTLHSDGEVFRAALGRSGVKIPPCCRDAAVPHPEIEMGNMTNQTVSRQDANILVFRVAWMLHGIPGNIWKPAEFCGNG